MMKTNDQNGPLSDTETAAADLATLRDNRASLSDLRERTAEEITQAEGVSREALDRLHKGEAAALDDVADAGHRLSALRTSHADLSEQIADLDGRVAFASRRDEISELEAKVRRSGETAITARAAFYDTSRRAVALATDLASERDAAQQAWTDAARSCFDALRSLERAGLDPARVLAVLEENGADLGAVRSESLHLNRWAAERRSAGWSVNYDTIDRPGDPGMNLSPAQVSAGQTLDEIRGRRLGDG